MKKRILAVIVLAALAGGSVYLWQAHLRAPIALAQIAAPYTAKSVCSCRFVAGRDMASCLQDFTVDVSALKIEDGPDRSVRSSALFGVISASAAYEDGYGCTLVAK